MTSAKPVSYLEMAKRRLDIHKSVYGEEWARLTPHHWKKKRAILSESPGKAFAPPTSRTPDTFTGTTVKAPAPGEPPIG